MLHAVFAVWQLQYKTDDYICHFNVVYNDGKGGCSLIQNDVCFIRGHVFAASGMVNLYKDGYSIA